MQNKLSVRVVGYVCYDASRASTKAKWIPFCGEHFFYYENMLQCFPLSRSRSNAEQILSYRISLYSA